MPQFIEAALVALRTGEATAEGLVRAAIAANETHAELNAIAYLDAERALQRASVLDRGLADNRWAGPLHGIPLTIKDLFNVDGMPTRAGTKAPLPHLGGESPAVTRLRQAGAIILGKANMHEVALGLTGESLFTGDVKNPYDPDRQAGGSSSGSAAAVAAGIGYASLGTDTGGSIRVPAALCGVAGFKPTHGLVPLDGALALSPTCDHAGPLARTIADARIVSEVLAGRPLGGGDLTVPPRLGVPRAYLRGRLATSVRAEFEALLVQLKDAGADVTDVTVQDIELTLPAYTPLVRAEAAFVHREALTSHAEDFSTPVRLALESGARLSAGEYLLALSQRRKVAAGLVAMFRETGISGLILPATPAPAVHRGETMVELESGPIIHRDAQLALSAPFSLTGVPTACLPFAWTDGLPLGLQVVAPYGEDGRALDTAAWIEAQIALNNDRHRPLQ